MSDSATTSTTTFDRRRLNPIHAILLGGILPLYLGAALTDYYYATSYEIEWSIFASWLIAGGLVFNGFALLCALLGLFRAGGRLGLAVIYCLLLLAAWLLGFINALVHARDAWAMMPTGLALSIVITVLAGAAALIGFSRLGSRGRS